MLGDVCGVSFEHECSKEHVTLPVARIFLDNFLNVAVDSSINTTFTYPLLDKVSF